MAFLLLFIPLFLTAETNKKINLQLQNQKHIA